jgi:phosphohistidine swiveling domain-containing protein
MTATSLHHFRNRLQGQQWLKGAVNYDEDLHFSSYYLRASSAHLTRPLYPGYSSFVASYEGFNETYYLQKEECHSCAAAIVEHALREPRWLTGIMGEIRRRSDALSDIFPPETAPDLLAKLPHSRLIGLYRRHDARQRALYKYARLPEALDRGESYFTNYLIEHLRSRGHSATACAEAFDVLSQPVVPSVLAKEMLEFDEIVADARPIVLALPSAISPCRARMMLSSELFRRLDTHRRKWQYLPYHGYGRRELASLNHYIERMLEQSRRPDTLASVSGLTVRCEHAERARQELLDRLQVDAAHGALFAQYAEIGAVKLYRRYAQLRNFYFLDMLLAEIARRLDVSEWTVRCTLPEEILISLKARRIKYSAIQERLEGCVFSAIDGQERIFTGAQAAELRRLVKPQSHAGRDSNVLRGVVASRGKAAGPCKVLIRADDCGSAFEKGTIVVSESTDPDLVRFLRAAGGVLTEQGGVTSHAAIICRELGIPTIIGIDGLLERVRDGDWVETRRAVLGAWLPFSPIGPALGFDRCRRSIGPSSR